MATMAGRQAFLEILHAAGVDHIIGNPGTTESPLVRACERRRNIRYVVALSDESGAVSYLKGGRRCFGSLTNC